MLLVLDPESLFLIEDDEAEILEPHTSGDKAVRADDDVDGAVANAREHLLGLLVSVESREGCETDWEGAEPFREGREVLLHQQGCRHEDRHLLTVLNRLEGSPYRDLSLAVADIAADEAVHRDLLLHIALDLVNAEQLVGGLDVGEGILEFVLPRRVRGERETLGRLTGGIQANELPGDLLHRLASPPLRLLPIRAAEPMNRWGLTPHIARHEIKLVGGNEETVRGLTALARCIFQDEVLAGGPGNLALNHLDVTPDAVLLMHDIVTDLQGKRIDRPPAPRRHLAHVLHRCTLSEDVLLGDDAEPYPREPEPHRDPSGRHGDDPRRRRIRDVVDEAARDVLSGEGLSESLSGSMALAQKHDALARSGPGGDVGECCRGVPPVGLQGRTAEIDDGLVMCFGIDRERGYLPPLPIRPHARRPDVVN